MVSPSQNNSNISNAFQIEGLTSNKVGHMYFPLAHKYTTQAHTFGQRIPDKLSCNWGNILGAYSCMHVDPSYCLSWIFIFIFVYPHFWPRPFQELRYLLWFILVNCGASQRFNIYMTKGHFDWPISKKNSFGMLCSLALMLTFFAQLFF